MPTTQTRSVTFFVNGEGMRGGRLNAGLSSATFLGAVETAPLYRFFSVRDEFPGLYPADEHGVAVRGEMYEVDYEVLRTTFLPAEPDELELDVIRLADGRGSLAMVLRRDQLQADGVADISSHGGWRAYRGLPIPD